MPGINEAAYSKLKQANKANLTGIGSYHIKRPSCRRDNDSEQTSKTPVFHEK